MAINKSGAHEKALDRKFGWAPIGRRSFEVSSFYYSKRWSILPALLVTGFIREPLLLQGTVNSALFTKWLIDSMLLHCNPYIEGEYMLRSVLFMDNAHIHKTQEVYDAITTTGVRLAFLPLYSPDFNPIELNFAILKAGVRRN